MDHENADCIRIASASKGLKYISSKVDAPATMSVGDFPLKDKIAIVTGGGSGINLSFAQFAVQHGARVIVADLKLTEDGEKFMKGEGAKAAVFAKCDVAKRADLENLIRVSEKEFGDVPDIYIAGAGVFEPVSLFRLCPEKGPIFHP
jgi:NAD(P)-dependent dehydrogenase (short-subunit alcohol dehydrogenase family)